MATQSVAHLADTAPLLSLLPLQDNLLAAFELVSRSRSFRRTRRLVELLQFAVNAATKGIKPDQSSIAAAVFGKGTEFDCSIDPLVRVQYSRLRTRLEEYYSHEGASDPYRIVVKPRGYEVTVVSAPKQATDGRVQTIADSGSAEHSSLATDNEVQPSHRALAVLPFVNLTNNPEHDVFCHGLTDELISALTTWDGVDVVSRGSSFQFCGIQMDVRELGRHLSVAMVLEGSVRMEDGRTRTTVQLCSTTSGFTLWSESFERENGPVIDVETGVAQEVLQQLKSVLPRIIPTSDEDVEIHEDEHSELALT